MPSVSDKQRRFMQAAAHSPNFARKAGIKQSVARDFNDADKARTGFIQQGQEPGVDETSEPYGPDADIPDDDEATRRRGSVRSDIMKAMRRGHNR